MQRAAVEPEKENLKTICSGKNDQNVRVPVNQGGRIGFGLGGGFNAARRAFLKIMGAGAATGVAAKSGLLGLLKSGKPTAQVLTSVPIKAGVHGMPDVVQASGK